MKLLSEIGKLRIETTWIVAEVAYVASVSVRFR